VLIIASLVNILPSRLFLRFFSFALSHFFVEFSSLLFVYIYMLQKFLYFCLYIIKYHALIKEKYMNNMN